MNGLLPKKEGAQNTALYSTPRSRSTLRPAISNGTRQHLETGHLDLDYSYERLLIDLTVNGEQRQGAGDDRQARHLEAIDRTNGQWLWHKETVHQNVVSAIDPKTGAKTINQAAIHHIGPDHRQLPGRPGQPGLAGRPPTDPKSGMLYCRSTSIARTRRRPRSMRARPIRVAAGRSTRAWRCPTATARSGACKRSSFSDQSKAWSYRTERAADRCGACPTGGGLVFSGAGSLLPGLRRHHRRCALADQLNNAVNSFPVHLYGERQAVCRGLGRNRLEPGALARDADAELQNPDGGSALWVFALPIDTALNFDCGRRLHASGGRLCDQATHATTPTTIRDKKREKTDLTITTRRVTMPVNRFWKSTVLDCRSSCCLAPRRRRSRALIDPATSRGHRRDAARPIRRHLRLDDVASYL